LTAIFAAALFTAGPGFVQAQARGQGKKADAKEDTTSPRTIRGLG